MNIEKVKKLLSENVKESRYDHSVQTMKMAKKITDHYEINDERISLAALLHDCGKIENSHDSDKNHAELGFILAKDVYGIEDMEIRNAIKFHTIGRKNMTDMEKVVYLADKIEESRLYEGVEEIREEAFKNMDEAIYMSMSRTFEYLMDNEIEIFPESKTAYFEFKRIHEERTAIKFILEAFEEKKGYDLSILDVSEVSSLADYFLICSSSSERQSRAIAQEVEDRLSELGLKVFHKDGMQTARWIIIDCGEIVIHIFNCDEREKYDFEEIWNRGKFIDTESFAINKL